MGEERWGKGVKVMRRGGAMAHVELMDVKVVDPYVIYSQTWPPNSCLLEKDS
jgi:hypothetical protein